jgi:hypothetical protein
MTKTQVENRVGVLMVLANVVVLLLAVLLYGIGGLLFDEFTTIVAIVSPMFSVYTTAIIKHFMTNSAHKADRSPRVTAQCALLCLLMPIAFTVLIVGAMVFKASNLVFATFEDFKNMVIAAETLFGTYVGSVLAGIFERAESTG